MKTFAISIYPDNMYINDSIKLGEYFNKAKIQGATGVFTSIHRPELSIESQLLGLKNLAILANQNGLKTTVDIGGSHFVAILNSPVYTQLFLEAQIDAIRLDYGFNREILVQFINAFSIRKIVLNTSILRQFEVEEIVALKDELVDLQISSCHNFYPRPETGLSLEFAQSQYQLFNRLGIEVIGFVRTYNYPRGPLFEGLPTLEVHRAATIEQQMIELVEQGVADNYLFGEAMLSDEEFTEIGRCLSNRVLEVRYLPVELCPTEMLNKLEAIEHFFRFDSPDGFLRSQTSREMAQFDQPIEPFNTIERAAYSLTIDNKKYQRYSGEVQVVMADAIASERVNIIGLVNKEDRWKLNYFRNGYTYRFIRDLT